MRSLGFALGFAVGMLAGVFLRELIEEPQEEYDPFALPYGEVVTLNHMLGTEHYTAASN